MSQSAPQTSADVTNIYQTSTQVRDIGLTGDAAVGLASVLAGASNVIAQSGFRLASDLNQQNSATLAGLINAEQDFSQRAIAAGTGQAAPIQQLGHAANEAGSANTGLILLVGLGISVILLVRGSA